METLRRFYDRYHAIKSPYADKDAKWEETIVHLRVLQIDWSSIAKELAILSRDVFDYHPSEDAGQDFEMWARLKLIADVENERRRVLDLALEKKLLIAQKSETPVKMDCSIDEAYKVLSFALTNHKNVTLEDGCLAMKIWGVHTSDQGGRDAGLILDVMIAERNGAVEIAPAKSEYDKRLRIEVSHHGYLAYAINLSA